MFFRNLAFLCLLALMAFPAKPQPKSPEKQLYVVTYVDVFPDFAVESLKQLLQFAADSRKDPGSIRFEVVQDVARTNHLMMVEVWQSRDAFEKHLTLPHSKTFREKLNPGLGSPFDERLSYLMQ